MVLWLAVDPRRFPQACLDLATMKIYYAANTDAPEGAALPWITNEIIPALTAVSLLTRRSCRATRLPRKLTVHSAFTKSNGKHLTGSSASQSAIRTITEM